MIWLQGNARSDALSEHEYVLIALFAKYPQSRTLGECGSGYLIQLSLSSSQHRGPEGLTVLLAIKLRGDLQLSLFSYGQLNEFLTLCRTTIVEGCGAFFTLDEEDVASFVGAIELSVRGFTTLVAVGDDVLADAFTQALVEDEVFAEVFILQAQCFALAGILNDASVYHADVLEATVEVISTGFLATDTAGAVHHDGLVFFVGEHVFYYRQEIAEVGDVWPDGAFEVANFTFVVVAHVNDDGLVLVQ